MNITEPLTEPAWTKVEIKMSQEEVEEAITEYLASRHTTFTAAAEINYFWHDFTVANQQVGGPGERMLRMQVVSDGEASPVERRKE